MCKNKFCGSCSQKNNCDGNIVQLFDNIQQYIYMHYKNKTIDGMHITENDFFQEIYYAAFFHLIYMGFLYREKEKLFRIFA